MRAESSIAADPALTDVGVLTGRAPGDYGPKMSSPDPATTRLVMPIPSDHLPRHQTLEVSKVADQVRSLLVESEVWFTRDSLRVITVDADVTAGPGDHIVIDGSVVSVVPRGV